MYPKLLVAILVGFVLVFSCTLPSFAASKKDLMRQLSQARVDFMNERDRLHDQNRILRIEWHQKRKELYRQLKQDPDDKAAMAELNRGAEKFHDDKELNNMIDYCDRSDILRYKVLAAFTEILTIDNDKIMKEINNRSKKTPGE